MAEPGEPARGTRFARVRAAYVGLAIFVLNGVLFFAALNLAVVPFHHDDAARENLLWPFLRERLPAVYPELSPADVEQLAREMLGEMIYEPYTDLAHPPTRGRFVNVDAAGFRWGRARPPWPLEHDAYNVFVFGGSTTFGYGVPDSDTVPSFLQERLGTVAGKPVRTYNFGRSAYYSTQERILFERLVTAGHVPDAAVFVDGLNDFSSPDDLPWSEGILKGRIGAPRLDWPRALKSVIDLLPLTVTVLHLARLAGSADEASPVVGVRSNDPAEVDRIIARWTRSKALIEGAARASGVSTTFVWQPIPTYGGVATGSDARVLASNLAGFAYPRFAAQVAAHSLGTNFVWCAEPGEGTLASLYVDAVHYGPVMADRVARCASDAMRARQLVP